MILNEDIDKQRRFQAKMMVDEIFQAVMCKSKSIGSTTFEQSLAKDMKDALNKCQDKGADIIRIYWSFA